MADNKTIHFIPPLPPKREKRVGIYCRVSTNSAEQLKSLTAQVSALTRLTAANLKLVLVDVKHSKQCRSKNSTEVML